MRQAEVQCKAIQIQMNENWMKLKHFHFEQKHIVSELIFKCLPNGTRPISHSLKMVGKHFLRRKIQNKFWLEGKPAQSCYKSGVNLDLYVLQNELILKEHFGKASILAYCMRRANLIRYIFISKEMKLSEKCDLPSCSRISIRFYQT